jgi:frataxin
VQHYDHKPTELSDTRYFRLADSTLNHLLHNLEEQADINPDIDVEYSDGVMNVTVGDTGTYVINRQPPSRQIWLSSPISGPKRFDYLESHGWVYKDGSKR